MKINQQCLSPPCFFQAVPSYVKALKNNNVAPVSPLPLVLRTRKGPPYWARAVLS